MNLIQLKISGFQSFGIEPTIIKIDNPSIFFIGPNGSGKTAALQALCRLFSFNPSYRHIRKTDFHISISDEDDDKERNLWIEAEFSLPELLDSSVRHPEIPVFLSHMQMQTGTRNVIVRFRLEATLYPDGEISDKLYCVKELDSSGNPLVKVEVHPRDRSKIQAHYLPAKREPAEHISYNTNALVGRLLRSINWKSEQEKVKDFADNITDTLGENSAIQSLNGVIDEVWKTLHKGSFLAQPEITFSGNDFELLLRSMSIVFQAQCGNEISDFSRLSDGQKSLLYLTLVIANQKINRSILHTQDDNFDIDKLAPPAFSLLLMEEPENSLSPHYLGRIISAFNTFISNNSSQGIIATHSPSMLKRIPPESIRHFRLNESRISVVSKIELPSASADASKYIREAVLAYPELYFSRLVVLCEGDSEEIVLPKVFECKDLLCDLAAISIVPLGGRHVNHFWKLLEALQIPYVTLLDLDLARFGGGWGRIKYALIQMLEHAPARSDVQKDKIDTLPTWNAPKGNIDEWISYLESKDIFYSIPLDLDFAMLQSFQDKYTNTLEASDGNTIRDALGKSHGDASQYSPREQALFATYKRLFKQSSKPATHISALANIEDSVFLSSMPQYLARLADRVKAKLEALPE